MKQSNRIKWLKIAQQAAATTPPPVSFVAPTISIMSLPGFKAALFQSKPQMIQHLEKLINMLNAHLYSLSAGKITFIQTWTNPSVSGSEYSNDLKHLVDLSKWIYTTVTTNSVREYTQEGLIQFINNLKNNINQRSFVDTSIKPDVLNECQIMLNLFGA